MLSLHEQKIWDLDRAVAIGVHLGLLLWTLHTVLPGLFLVGETSLHGQKFLDIDRAIAIGIHLLHVRENNCVVAIGIHLVAGRLCELDEEVARKRRLASCTSCS